MFRRRMPGGKWRVLVVDDEPDLRELITLTLSLDDRLEVAGVASSGEDALSLLASSGDGGPHVIDLVVLDQWLGGPLTGTDVALELRARWPGVRVVLFTAVDDVEVDLRTRQSVDAVLGKPDLVRLPDVAMGVMSD